MPLVRVEVRSEYGLGAPELYTEADKEDPKDVLEGVAVAGLVGILRQLGDLAEFAAEVFHGLQEAVMITSSRSHKLMGRVQRIEAALPPLEKLVLAQRSHLHFAYTAGANWHSHLRCEQSHFIYSDLPRFIMDSYDHCRGPPRLDLLDKFDPGGPGSCLKRYSDPSFFKRASSGSDGAYVDKILKGKKSRKIKKKRSLRKTGEVSRGASFSNTSSRMQFASLNNDGQTSPHQMFSTYGAPKSDMGDQSISLGSRYWSGDLEHVSRPSYSMDNVEKESRESYSSPLRTPRSDPDNYVFVDEKGAVLDDMCSSLSEEQTGPCSFNVTGDEKTQISEPAAMEYEHDETMRIFSMNFDLGNEDKAAFNFETAKEYDHDENLETLAANFAREIEERGASNIKTANEYDYRHTLETVSTNFDQETEERGTSHLTAAEGYDLDETLETLDYNFDLETDRNDFHLKSASQMDSHLESDSLSMPITGGIQLGASESEAVSQMNSQLANENVPMSISGYVQHDDIESETNNYVDAPNTIESEYETDVDVPTNKVEQFSDSGNKAVDGGVDLLTTGHSGNYSSNPKSLIATSGSLDNGTLGDDPYPVLPETCSRDKVTDDLSDSVPLETSAFVQSPQIADKSLNSGSLPYIDSCEIGNNLASPNANSVTSNISSDSIPRSLVVPVSDKITSSLPELQKPYPETSSVASVKFWTNGGLLGLEPSKPPDFSMLNVSSELSVKSKDDTIGTSTQKPDITEKRSVEETAVPECSTSCQDDRKGGMFIKKASWLFSSADLGVNLQKVTDSYNQCYIDSSQHYGNSETYGTVQPVSSDIQSNRASQDKSSNSSRMFELGNRLLMNRFHRKPSFDMDDNFNSNSSPNAAVFELKNSLPNVDNKKISFKSKDMLRIGSPVVSPSSSPPIGHMKISFQPVNGFEAHKLQLKFPDGNVNRDSGRDMFPSFQLVPESTIRLHDTGSDSEDDTFCRSSPCGSDCLSHQSDSNSEQWESSESPTSKEHELYDSLRSISFTDSTPTSWDTGEAVQGEVNNNCKPQISLARKSVEYSQSGHLFDLPSFDTLQTSLVERSDCDLNSFTEPHYPKEATPSPPPLPPPQWRAMKQEVELADDWQGIISENLNYAFDRKFGSTISQQPKPAPIKQEQIFEATPSLKSKHPELKKTIGQKEVNRSVSLKELEEKEDFLHQIRTKSFNLRRTATTKPTVTTGPPTNFQVTAILKKANEIRQAVGSDGEDDTWSDT